LGSQQGGARGGEVTSTKPVEVVLRHINGWNRGRKTDTYGGKREGDLGVSYFQGAHLGKRKDENGELFGGKKGSNRGGGKGKRISPI